jgi:nucleoside-diphosphate-sugar epimerase
LRVYNLSSGVATSIARLAEMARDAVGHALPPVETEPGTRHDDRIVLDIERLRARTGWVPSIPLADGLQQILRVLGDERA